MLTMNVTVCRRQRFWDESRWMAAVNAVTTEPLTRNEMIEPEGTIYWGYDRRMDALFLTPKEPP